MEMTTRELWTLVHGMGFGALYLMACPVALIELCRRYRPGSLDRISTSDESFVGWWLMVMAVLAWITVLTGAYVIYPWYRAVPAGGAADLSAFPQALLKSNPATIGWHSVGMEWKEHIAWIVPISSTTAAAVLMRYRRCLRNYATLRAAVIVFVLVSFASAAVAGFFGAELSKHAPVKGGTKLGFMRGKE